MSTHTSPPVGPDSTKVAENIRMIMARDRVTLRDLSSRMEGLGRPVSIAQLSRIASGQRSIDIDQLRAISTALGLTMAGALDGVI